MSARVCCRKVARVSGFGVGETNHGEMGERKRDLHERLVSAVLAFSMSLRSLGRVGMPGGG